MAGKIALLVSGASGMRIPRQLLRRLTEVEEIEELHLVVSRGASQVLAHELGAEQTGAGDLVKAAELSDAARAKVVLHRDNALDAPIASGSFALQGTVIAPCSAATLGALAVGTGRTLIHRAGAVALKERWPLVLGFRETPLTLIHVENMRRLAYAGAILLPPVPAFYIRGETLDRFLDHYALRVLDRLGFHQRDEQGLRWPDVEP